MLKLRILIVLLSLLLMTSAKATAQGFIQPIFRGGSITGVSYSADSQILSFVDGSIGRLVSSTAGQSYGQWFKYVLSTKVLTTANEWPLQPPLTTEELNLYQPATSRVGAGSGPAFRSFIFAGPNSNYIVFASNIGFNDRGYPVYIANRSQQVMAETYTRAYGPADSLEMFKVVWNRTGTAFMVASETYDSIGLDPSIEGHVSSFTTTLANIKTTRMNVVLGGLEARVDTIFGISDDGASVLLRATDYMSNTSYPYVVRIVIWNATSLASTMVGTFDGNQVIGAGFEQGDPNRVLMVTPMGLVRYTMNTGQITVLSTIISTSWVDPDYKPSTAAVFSPDGRWLAVLRGETLGNAIYVFDLTTDFAPTPTPNTTGIKVQYYPESSTRGTFVESIMPTLNIVNQTSSTVNLSELKIRYYFTRDSTTQALQSACAWTDRQPSCANVTVTTGLLATPVNGADAYVEVGFTSGIIQPSSETLDIVVRVNKQDWSSFIQPNDYSFDPLSEVPIWVDWTRVTLYRNGTRIWGIEPS